MKRNIALFAFLLMVVSGLLAQDRTDLKITHGPVLEGTHANTATIAWTTNVNSGTRVEYGLDPQHLDRRAEMPWGGITHRVTLKGLQPGTTYYWRAVSTKGQGTGEDAVSDTQTLTTQPDGSSPQQ